MIDVWASTSVLRQSSSCELWVTEEWSIEPRKKEGTADHHVQPVQSVRLPGARVERHSGVHHRDKRAAESTTTTATEALSLWLGPRESRPFAL
jgi:hypothetical protein